MAFQRIEALPTSDIHLLMSHPTKPFEMIVWAVIDALTRVNVSSHSATTFHAFGGPYPIAKVVVANPTTPAAAMLHFTPLKVGETIGRITHADGSTTHELLVRVRVHERVDAFWLGNNEVTLKGRPAPTFAGPTNYVLSVYARFSDGTLGDISSHPYLDFSSRDTNVVELTIPAAEGRLRAVDPGDTHVDVKHGAV